MLGLLWMLIVFGYLIAASVKTDRPLATVAAWLIAIAALLVWFGVAPPPSAPALAWSGLFTVAGLALTAAYLARDGRAGEIAVWAPALLAGLAGWLYFLAAVYDERGRTARGVLAALLLAVPISLWGTVGHWTGISFGA